ncbi:hypothetical protein WR25_04020 [Diploscapter pachys]|uniref:Uncharacterized protein n=1 Tax=Diploscapter pachys TaxID=2018661 RepID=A0A2A2KLL6_9BILA|nr:hypothetical protein WR25_04020 [Diploscapter pachys]
MSKLFEYLLLSTVFPVIVYGFHAPTIKANFDIKNDKNIGNYIELKAGDSLELKCSTADNKEVVFSLPNLSDYVGYSVENFKNRKTEEFDKDYLIYKLAIKDMKAGLSSFKLIEKAPSK